MSPAEQHGAAVVVTSCSLRYRFGYRKSDATDALFESVRLVQVPLSEIRELKETYWFGLGAPPTSEDIAEHAKLIYEADISYPIILCLEGKVMDGMHRVCRAFLESRETVPAVRFAELHEPDHVGKQPDELPY